MPTHKPLKTYFPKKLDMENEYGDFQEIKEETKTQNQELEEQVSTRLRMPRHPELLGVVLQRLGGNRMNVKTTDGKTRNCRVPGRFKKRFWIRVNDAVIIIPWPDDDNKGDVIFHYNKNATYQLKKRGLLKNLEEKF